MTAGLASEAARMSNDLERTALFRLQGILESLRGGFEENHSKVATGLAEIIVELGANPGLSRYHALAQELVRAVVREIETPIRIEIAKRLAKETDVAREITRILANDQIEVAWPILEGCATLHDEDLVEVAINRSPRHRLAIAQRKVFSELVSASLVCFSERDVVEAVLRNPGARISGATFEHIGTIAKIHPDLQDPLVRRGDLPLLLAFGMLEWVVGALHVFLYERIGGEPNALKRIIGEAIDAKTLAQTLEENVRELINGFVAATRSLSEADVIAILEGLPSGRRDLKMALVSDYMFEPLRSIRETVASGNAAWFATLCRAADVAKPVFEAMVEHLFSRSPGVVTRDIGDSGVLLLAVHEYMSKTPQQARAEVAAAARGSV